MARKPNSEKDTATTSGPTDTAAKPDVVKKVADKVTTVEKSLAATQSFEKTAANLKILVLSALAGAAVAILVGGLIYFQMRSDFRTMSGAQAKSLVVFSENIDRLSGVLEVTEEMQTDQQLFQTALMEKVTHHSAELKEAPANLVSQPRDDPMLDGTDTAPPETAIVRPSADGLLALREDLKKNKSDLLLAISKMVAARGECDSGQYSETLASISSDLRALNKRPTAPKPRPASKPRPAPRPKIDDNPLKFP
jgi:hypothetical protein